MYVAKELALSMAYVAAAALTEDDPLRRRRMLASAKLETARAGRQLAQAAVQLHGGMGMTDELEVGDYFKRLTVADQLLGDSAEQLAVLGAGAGGGGNMNDVADVGNDEAGYAQIRFSLRQGVGRITLNRPERLNSFTEAMHAELAARWTRWRPARACAD